MTKIRTRYAPSPTGKMHVGNLRTALYAYLIAKHEDGDYILRIEDTDQERFVEGATEIIYNTLIDTGLKHDEGLISAARWDRTYRAIARNRGSIWNMPKCCWTRVRRITVSADRKG